MCQRLREMKGHLLEVDFPVFCAFVDYYKEWRAILVAYLDISAADANKLLARIFNLAPPKQELPFLWAFV